MIICPNCKHENSIVYSTQVPYEHIYQIKKDSKLSKNFRKRCLGDSQYDCFYCLNCLKEFEPNFTTNGRVSLNYED